MEAAAVPGSVALPWNWVCREMGALGSGKMLWNPVGIGEKERGVGDKKKKFPFPGCRTKTNSWH